jgi:hypothetical protein
MCDQSLDPPRRDTAGSYGASEWDMLAQAARAIPEFKAGRFCGLYRTMFLDALANGKVQLFRVAANGGRAADYHFDWHSDPYSTEMHIYTGEDQGGHYLFGDPLYIGVSHCP